MKSTILSLFILACLNLTGYSQWQQTTGTPEGKGITDMVITSNGTIVVTCASYNFPNGQFGGIRHSTNSGATWVNDYQHYVGRTLALGQNGYVWASSWNYPSYTEGLWVSYNQGAMWQGFTYLVGTNNNIFSILVRDNNQTVYIGTRTGVRKSTNGGSTFTPVNNGIPVNSWVRDIEADSAGVLAAATTNGLFISTNNASSWVQATGIQAGDTIVKLSFDYNVQLDGSGLDIRLLGGTESGILYESTGQYYTALVVEYIFGATEISDIEIEYLDTSKVMAVLTYQNNSQSSGCSISTNNGSTWGQYNNGLPQLITLTAVAYGSLAAGILAVFLGTDFNAADGARIYKWLKTIGIHPTSSEIPNEYSLSQNYPNPFNPNSNIKFQISKLSDVRLIVFDALGREVETLVNRQLKPGTYEVDFDGSKLSSGVYFYKLVANDFTETKKMVLVK